MTRIRWLSVKWAMPIRVLAKHLQSYAFGGERKQGFLLDRVRDDFLEARFVDKIEFDEILTDPFGEESRVHRIEYRKCEFRATVQRPGLELVNSPRSLNDFISRLSEATNFSLGISPIIVDVLAWGARLRSRLDAAGIVDCLQYGAVELAPGVRARAVVTGEKDVVSPSSELFSGRRYTLEKLRFRFHDRKQSSIVLSNNAAVRFGNTPSDEFLSAVRATLYA